MARVRHTAIAAAPTQPIETMRRLSVLLVLAGLALQSALPGFELAMRARVPWTLLGFNVSICHSSTSGQPAGDAEQVPGDGCCLVCQAVELAKGALPSPTFTLPTTGTAPLPRSAATAAAAEGHASLHKLPRAPPLD
ncbi:MAG: hypothetical protein ACM31L_03875 [Actinomycetota bacterium]